MRGDVAIIIGAMVIAPLLGPNVGLSLATTLGDTKLAGRSLKVIGMSFLTTCILSMLIGMVFPVDPGAPELVTRSTVGVSDITLALAAGSAGALAHTSGIVSALVGVMVSVALLPPLVAAWILAGSGHPDQATGAIILFLANITSINLTGVVTFWAQRIRPATLWEEEKAKRATRVATTLLLALLSVLVALIVLVMNE